MFTACVLACLPARLLACSPARLITGPVCFLVCYPMSVGTTTYKCEPKPTAVCLRSILHIKRTPRQDDRSHVVYMCHDDRRKHSSSVSDRGRAARDAVSFQRLTKCTATNHSRSLVGRCIQSIVFSLDLCVSSSPALIFLPFYRTGDSLSTCRASFGTGGHEGIIVQIASFLKRERWHTHAYLMRRRALHSLCVTDS